MRRARRGSSRSTCSSRVRPSRPSCSPSSRRSRTRPARSASTAATISHAGRATSRSRSGTCTIPATSARCFAPRTRSTLRSRSRPAAATRPARSRCARRWGRSSAFRLAAFEEAGQPRVALVSRGGTPLPELDLGDRVTFVLGAEREGLPGRRPARVRGRRDDPAGGARRLAERRSRRRDRALRGVAPRRRA